MKKILIAVASLVTIVLIIFVALGLRGGGENEYYYDENDYDEQYQPEPYTQPPKAPLEPPAQAAPPDYIYEAPAVDPPYPWPGSGPEEPFELLCGEVAIPPMSDEERAALDEYLRKNPPPAAFMPMRTELEDGSIAVIDSPESMTIYGTDGSRTQIDGITIAADWSIILPDGTVIMPDGSIIRP